MLEIKKGFDFFIPNTIITQKDINDVEIKLGKLPPLYSDFITKWQVGFGNLSIKEDIPISSFIKNKAYRLWEFHTLQEVVMVMLNLNNFFPDGHQVKYGLLQIGIGNYSGEKFFIGTQSWNLDTLYMIDTNEVFDDLEGIEITEEMKNKFNEDFKISNNITEFVEGLRYDFD